MYQLHDIANRFDEAFHVRFGDNQWGRHLQDHEIVAADLRENALVAKQPHHYDLSEQSGVDLAKSLEWDPETELARCGELDAGEQARTAHLLHHFVIRQLLAQPRAQLLAKPHRAPSQIFLFQHIERRQSGTHSQGVFAEGGRMHDGPPQRIVDGFIHGVGHEHRTNGDQTAAESLRQNHHVRGTVELVSRQKRPCAIHASLHFIEHKQRSEAMAEFPRAAKIIGRRYADACLRLHRLHDECREPLRRQFRLKRRGIAEGNCRGIGQHGPEAVAPERIAHQGQRAAGEAVKRAVRVQEPGAVRVHASELDGCFHPRCRNCRRKPC